MKKIIKHYSKGKDGRITEVNPNWRHKCIPQCAGNRRLLRKVHKLLNHLADSIKQLADDIQVEIKPVKKKKK